MKIPATLQLDFLVRGGLGTVLRLQQMIGQANSAPVLGYDPGNLRVKSVRSRRGPIGHIEVRITFEGLS